MSRLKERLDTLLLARRLAPDEKTARALILSGHVLVDGNPIDKVGAKVPENAQIRIRSSLPTKTYVSRGGMKLKFALDTFGAVVRDKVAIDVGASTGGFTDCLLKEGARRVYAIDVGYGQLAWKLRQDPRVVVLERTNIRTFDPRGIITDPIDLAVIDVSFISLRLVIPVVKTLLSPAGQMIALVKPQFETRKEKVEKGGVLRDPKEKDKILKEIIFFCHEEGINILNTTPSPLLGPAGNEEFFIFGIKGREKHAD